MKESAFFSILELHGIELEKGQRAAIKKDFSKKIAGKPDVMILYNEAIASMNVDLTAAALRDEVKWEVASSQAPKPLKKQD